MLEFLKNYYVFMLILMVISFLVPKKEYKTYMQHFIGIFMIVLLLRPLLELFTAEEPNLIYEVFDTFNVQIEEFDISKEENIFEHFFYKGEGE